MSIKFNDYSIEVKEALEKTAVAFLNEAAGELAAQTVRNIPNKGEWFNEQKVQWRHEVDEGKLEATVGNPQERSLWTEFGTGSFAENGDGRKGYWIFVKGSGGSENTSASGGRPYTLEEAKRYVAMMRDEGLDAYYTRGQKAYKPFQNAYTKMKPKIIKMGQQRFKNLR